MAEYRQLVTVTSWPMPKMSASDREEKMQRRWTTAKHTL